MSVVEVANVQKHYGSTVAVADVSLRAETGQVLGILGRNGAGKTTMVEMIAGLRIPDAGRVRVRGLDPVRDRAKVRQVLGVQLQDAALHDALTVIELARLYRTFYHHGRDPEEVIEAVGLGEQRRTRFANLSGGQQQRLSVALALIGDPSILILDELTTGLDPRARRQMWKLVESIRASGVTILLVSHLMEEVERLCEQVAIMDAGRILARDTPAGLIAAADLGEHVRFRLTQPLPPGIFAHIGDVQVSIDGRPVGAGEGASDGGLVTVSGSGDLLQQVSTALVRAEVVATETRLVQPSLEDAFLALTGREGETNDDDAAGGRERPAREKVLEETR